jgi:hypothetical protein
MKGFTNNINGRPKGVPNKITKELKALITEFLNEQWDSIKEDFRALEPKERLIYYEKLLAYCIPKNSPIEVDEALIKEQPLFYEVRSYSLDEQAIKSMPYEDLKQLILQSEVFMKAKQGTNYQLEVRNN